MKKIPFIIGFLCSFSFLSFAYASLQVDDIKVNIKSDSGLKARELAIADARRKAFIKLIQNNSSFSYDLQSKGLPADKALESATDTFQIKEERISPYSYRGVLSITFSDQGFRDLLNGNYDPVTRGDSTKDKPVGEIDSNYKDAILLPIYLTSDESLMWQPSPWHVFWKTVPQDDVLKTFIPLGDVEDIMGVSIEDIMTGKYRRVQGLMTRYKKKSLVVAVLKRVSIDHDELELTVKLFNQDRLVFSSDPIFIEGETLEQGFLNARIELIKALQNQSASVLNTKNDGLQSYTITASFNSFAQWQHIRRGLKMRAIKGFKVTSLSRTYANITLQSLLPSNELSGALAGRGLIFTETRPGHYELSTGERKQRRLRSYLEQGEGQEAKIQTLKKSISPFSAVNVAHIESEAKDKTSEEAGN